MGEIGPEQRADVPFRAAFPFVFCGAVSQDRWSIRPGVGSEHRAVS